MIQDRDVEVLVLGAGLQGAGIALELAERGVPTTLIEQDALPLNRASLRNEGKIHLGIIYANDRLMGTAELQLEGALRFRSIVTRWMQGDSQWLAPSTPFHYLVAEDSVLSPVLLAQHYEAVSQRCRTLLAQHPELDYLGERPNQLTQALPREMLAPRFDPSRIIAAFETVERAIDTEVMAVAVRRAVLGHSEITFMHSHTVQAIVQQSDHIRVEGDGPQGPWRVCARQVVNALWDQRLRFDQQMGLPMPGDLLHRLKYRVIARLPERLRGAPSVTMVLGRYGDVVVRGDGTVYLSWYPAGLRGWTNDLVPPAEWDPACRGEVPAPFAREIAHETMKAIDAWYPGIGECDSMVVDAGVIVAIGRSDVDDVASALHGRSHVGVTSQGGYHSVDAGKLTTVPMFALKAADRVQEVRRALGVAH